MDWFIYTHANHVIRNRRHAADKRHPQMLRFKHRESARRWEDSLIAKANQIIRENTR